MRPTLPPFALRQLLCLACIVAPLGAWWGQRALGERPGPSVGLVGAALTFEGASKRLGPSPTGSPLLPQQGPLEPYGVPVGARPHRARPHRAPHPPTARAMLIRFGSWRLEGG